LVLDGNRLSVPNEDGESRAMETALSQARVPHQDVQYINCHGSSSPKGDETEIKAIHQQNGTIHSLTYEKEGVKKTIPCDHLISTIPLRQTTQLLDPVVPSEVKTAAEGLIHKDILFLNIILSRNSHSDQHMIYLMDQGFKSNRLAEMKNATLHAAPEGKTVLTLEIPCTRGDELWNLDVNQIYSYVNEDLKRCEIDEKDVEEYFLTRFIDAYPVFDINFEKKVKAVLEHSQEFNNLYITGRQGLFLNIDMHDSMRLGKRTAEFLMLNKTSRGWINEAKDVIRRFNL